MENALSTNSIRCGRSSAFTHRTVELIFTVMFAGLNVFFWIIMVLSDTDAVREGVTTGVGKGTAMAGEGVTGATAGVTAGITGGVWEHPQMNINGRAIMRRSGAGLIDATQVFPYNKLMA